LIPQNREFVVVNAFANGPFGGNPAAVFANASDLTSETMQAFARQLNLVETVFIVAGEKDIDFRLRYFTPDSEIPVAGHPSIAAWLALVHNRMIDATLRTRYLQANLAGTQEIEIDYSVPESPVVTMKQPPARFLDTDCTKEQVASVFSLSENDLAPELPIRAVDTGLGHLIVPLRSLDALFRVQRQIEPLRQLCRSVGVREAQLFCFETVNSSYDMHTRNLCPREGIEDPACGVGNGALSAYISKFCWTTKTEFSLKIEQGNIVQMPSLIHTRTIKRNEAIDVFVGGAGTVMLEGHFVV
jgi:trans-2,3-dihydro-3-hydroxyanthranilate isomerase